MLHLTCEGLKSRFAIDTETVATHIYSQSRPENRMIGLAARTGIQAMDCVTGGAIKCSEGMPRRRAAACENKATDARGVHHDQKSSWIFHHAADGCNDLDSSDNPGFSVLPSPLLLLRTSLARAALASSPLSLQAIPSSTLLLLLLISEEAPFPRSIRLQPPCAMKRTAAAGEPK